MQITIAIAPYFWISVFLTGDEFETSGLLGPRSILPSMHVKPLTCGKEQVLCDLQIVSDRGTIAQIERRAAPSQRPKNTTLWGKICLVSAVFSLVLPPYWLIFSNLAGG